MWIDDQILGQSANELHTVVWRPVSPIVVLGSSNVAALEVHEANCRAENVPILRRYGGGGTVLLYQGCVVVSLGAWVRQIYQNSFYFGLVNGALIDALGNAWPSLAALEQRGLSDLVWGDRKIAGTSLFRSRHYLLYQASIIVEPAPVLIDRYLKHPSREPNYRRGRTHRDFLGSLQDVVGGISPAEVVHKLDATLSAAVRSRLQAEAIGPIASEFPALKDRAARGAANA